MPTPIVPTIPNKITAGFWWWWKHWPDIEFRTTREH